MDRLLFDPRIRGSLGAHAAEFLPKSGRVQACLEGGARWPHPALTRCHSGAGKERSAAFLRYLGEQSHPNVQSPPQLKGLIHQELNSTRAPVK